MSTATRQGMRLALYIKLMGCEPIVCEHPDYKVYLGLLQAQYEEFTKTLDPALVSTARMQGRALIRSDTVSGAVRKLFPGPGPFAPYIPKKRPKGPAHTPAKVRPAPPPRQLPSPTSGKTRKRRERSCTYKLRHPNVLSALLHAADLNDDGLVIYECEFCDGLHVGHALKRYLGTQLHCSEPIPLLTTGIPR